MICRAVLLLLLVTTGLCSAEQDAPESYAHPGAIAKRGGEWIGSDHLLHLSDGIAVEAEVLTVSQIKLPFSSNDLSEVVKKVFTRYDIEPTAGNNPLGAPLPQFHLLAMVYPAEDKLVVYVEGRLFESVNLERANLPKSVLFQAITWETQDMVMIKKQELKKELERLTEQIAELFAERAQFFRAQSSP